MQFKQSIAALLSLAGLATAQIVGSATLSQETSGQALCSSTCGTNGDFIGVSPDFFAAFGCGTGIRITPTGATSPSIAAQICFSCPGCTGEPNAAAGSPPDIWEGSEALSSAAPPETSGQALCSSTCGTNGDFIGVSPDFFAAFGCGTGIRITPTGATSPSIAAQICFSCPGCTGEPNAAAGSPPDIWEGSEALLGQLGKGTSNVAVSWDI
ncbi:hypothetical protein BOTBODRAFT_172354 [Botryobasidium botryosum FD-172 SS1]|uniref:Uncharacterized protein n=1 Tax=Botryobasidium botryosum (strain FD-172 SS1) TaxID=930990 RepID=A0A067MRJ6_BOTB1|nr:hypothetical protein BOTBODRAFT_172354 [Botryobasidium botryosum FD-172 SS1]